MRAISDCRRIVGTRSGDWKNDSMRKLRASNVTLAELTCWFAAQLRTSRAVRFIEN
jgi:hypothetical protein